MSFTNPGENYDKFTTSLEELQMYCKSHYLSYVTEVGIYKALP